MLDAVPEDSARMLKTFGVAAPERRSRSCRTRCSMPTLNVRGLASSFVGAGARTIVPDRATAAIDIRLVKETSERPGREAPGAHREAGLPPGRRRSRTTRRARSTRRSRDCRLRADPTTRSARRRATRRRARSSRRSRRPSASRRCSFGRSAAQCRSRRSSRRSAFPAMLVPTVNFDNNQHEENENLRLGTFFDSIVTIAAVLRMNPTRASAASEPTRTEQGDRRLRESVWGVRGAKPHEVTIDINCDMGESFGACGWGRTRRSCRTSRPRTSRAARTRAIRP